MQNTETLAQIAEAIPHLVWTTRPDGYTTFFNQKFFDYTGKNQKELEGWGWQSILHSDDLEACLKRWNHAKDSGETYEIEYRLRRHDGVFRWFLGRAHPLRNDRDEIVTWFGTCTDIEDQKQERIMLQTVMDNISQSIFWKDRNSVFLGCNKHFAQDFGLASPSDIIGRTDYDLGAPTQEQVEFFRKCDQVVMNNDAPEYHIIEPVLKADGRTAWLDTSKVPLHNASNEVIGLVGMYEDVTEREKLIMQREDFMASLAHDLKVPIVGAITVMEAILKGTTGPISEEQAELVTMLRLSHENLLQMVNNLLQVLKYEADADELYFSAFDFPELLAACLAEMKPVADNKRVSLQLSLPESAEIYGDRFALEQLTQNLLAIALDFSPASATISLKLDLNGNDSYSMMISNTGEPIKPDDLELLFQRFGQGRRFGVGTGLGLYLSRLIVERHGGSISCTSTKEEGTRMVATIPMKACPVQRERSSRSRLSVSPTVAT